MFLYGSRVLLSRDFRLKKTHLKRISGCPWDPATPCRAWHLQAFSIFCSILFWLQKFLSPKYICLHSAFTFRTLINQQSLLGKVNAPASGVLMSECFLFSCSKSEEPQLPACLVYVFRLLVCLKCTFNIQVEPHVCSWGCL